MNTSILICLHAFHIVMVIDSNFVIMALRMGPVPLFKISCYLVICPCVLVMAISYLYFSCVNLPSI